MPYKIIRFYRDGDSEVVARGLTEEEAKAHCNDPETSSETATDPDLSRGPWFDGFDIDVPPAPHVAVPIDGQNRAAAWR